MEEDGRSASDTRDTPAKRRANVMDRFNGPRAQIVPIPSWPTQARMTFARLLEQYFSHAGSHMKIALSRNFVYSLARR